MYPGKRLSVSGSLFFFVLPGTHFSLRVFALQPIFNNIVSAFTLTTCLMTKPLLALLIIILAPLSAAAQQALLFFDSAETLLDSGQVSESITLYQSALKQAQSDSMRLRILNSLAVATLEEGNEKDALDKLDEAVAIASAMELPYHSEWSVAWLSVSTIHARAKRLAEAKEAAEQALAIRLEHQQEEDSLVTQVYEQLAKICRQQGDFGTALDYTLAAIDYIRNLKDADAPELCGMHQVASVTAWNFGDLDKALDHGNEALRVCKLYDSLRQEVGISYNNLGLISNARFELRNALDYYNEAVGIYKSLPAEEQSKTDIAIAYNNISTIMSNLGDYHSRYEYMTQVVDLLTEDLGRDHRYTAIAHNNMAAACRQLKRYDEAMKHHKIALGIRKRILGKNHPDVAQSYHNLGVLYGELEDYGKLFAYADTAQQIRQVYMDPSHPNLARGWSVLGKAAARLGDHAAEARYLSKALVAFEAQFNIHPALAAAHKDWGDYLLQQGDTTAALLSYQKALAANVQGFAPHTTSNPAGHPLSETTQAKILSQKALIQEKQAMSRKDDEGLLAAWETYKLAAHMVDTARFRITSEESRQQLLENARPIYEGSMRVLWQLQSRGIEGNWSNEAFALAEHYKSVLLMESVAESIALKSAGLPPALVARQKLLQKTVSDWDAAWYKAVTRNDSAAMALSRDSLFFARRDWNAFQDSLEQVMPAFAEMKQSWRGQVPADQIAKELAPNEQMIAFFICQNSLFSFQISTGGVQWYRQELSEERERAILSWIESLRSPRTDYTATDREAFARQGHDIYTYLLGEISAATPLSERLVIVPDGMLGYLPFELLLSKEAGDAPFRKMPYLLRDRRISYAYSGSLWHYAARSPHVEAATQLAAFAPDYAPGNWAEASDSTEDLVAMLVRSGEMPLPGAQEESRRISSMLSGVAWLGNEATEERFKNIAHQYGILHLSMHGVIDDENPQYSKLLFAHAPGSKEDGLLNASELYHLPLNARLVVLSACNTGFGKIKAGEGIMSLSRAFTYAGCPSTVMSLWKVPDAATSQLMVHFYRGLRDGLPKDEALRQAKLNYLDQIEDPLTAHPYYWAGFVQAGNPEKVDFRTTSRSYLWLVLVLCCITGITIWFKNRKQSAEA